MSNTNTEVLSTAYEKLQGAITQSNTVLPKLEEAVEKGNLDNYATVSQLEDIANKVNKIIDIDYFSGSTDDEKLSSAITFCKSNGYSLSISRKVTLTKAITKYDFSFSILGTSKDAELYLNSTSTIETFFDITAPTGIVYNTKVSDIIINANKKANICVWLKKGKANCFSNVTIKHSLDKDFQIGKDTDNKVIELNCNKIYVIGGELTDGSSMSNYNIYIQGASSDNNFIDVTCVNATECNIFEEGWSNQWTQVHCYGYPYQQIAKMNFKITGRFGTYNNIQCDTFKEEAIYIQGHYMCFNNIKIQTKLDLYPNAGGILIDSMDSSSSNIVINNIMFKRFNLTDTEYYPFDIKFTDKVFMTFEVNNISNDVVTKENRITQMYSQSILIPDGTTSFKATLPYELENNNYVILFNTLYNSSVTLTSKGTKDIWFEVSSAPSSGNGWFCFLLKYKKNT